MSTVISVENVSKLYRLGEIGTGSLAHDVNRWWHKVRGKEDPYLKIGQVNDRTKTAGSQGTGNGKQESEPAETSSSTPSPASRLLSPSSSDYVYALKDVSFEVKQGEVLGIIGRNGAGKSTLLKILSRVTTPTSGEIKAKGRIASLLEVGTGFHPELSGRDNIYLNGAILGMRKHEIASKFDEIVEFSGCERYIDTPVKRYSSGMYVRLAFAVAAHLEPEILIVDEVLAVGDAEFQMKCLGKMKDVAGQGRTVLFVSHNVAAMRTICNNGLLLQNGQIKTSGTIEATIDAYSSISAEVDATHTIVIQKPRSYCDPTIESITIYKNDEPDLKFEYGDKLSLEIRFKAEHPIKKPLIGYMIRSLSGADVLNANNYFLPSADFPSPVTSGSIRCDLGHLPLLAGRYAISFWLGRHAHAQHHVEDAIQFTVEEKDIWGTGKLPSNEISLLWWPTEFSFMPPDNQL